MLYVLKNYELKELNIFYNVGVPAPDGPGFSNPWVITTVVFMTISVMLPCIFWFLRNFTRIILKKDYEWFNRSIKWMLLACLICFILSIILMILAIRGII